MDVSWSLQYPVNGTDERNAFTQDMGTHKQVFAFPC